MSDKFDAAIQDIAVKHGVVLGKDDPILILHTMNEKLIEETRKAQPDFVDSLKRKWKAFPLNGEMMLRKKLKKLSMQH